MSQLKMYWFPGTPIKDEPLPPGYSISNYKTEADKEAWVKCCRDGLIGDNEGTEAFDNTILHCEFIDPCRDTFFLDYEGEHIGTVTAFNHTDVNEGDMHMVAIRTDFRGKALSKYLSIITLKKLSAEGVSLIHLTTDDWRKGAVKGYLNAGFLPVEYNEGMVDRWCTLLEELKIDSVQMVDNDGNPYKILYRTGLKGEN